MPAVPAGPPGAPVSRPIRVVKPFCMFVASTLAAACGSSAALTAASTRVRKPDATAAIVPATSVARLYIAQQRDYFTAAGPRVRLTPVASGASALPNLVNGSVDVGEGRWTSDLAAEAAGAARLRVLAPGDSGGTAPEEVVTPPDSAIRTVNQLRGKTIAVNALNGLAVLLTANVPNSYGIPASTAYVPDGVPAFGAFMRRLPFGDIGAFEQTLTQPGYLDVATVTPDTTLTYASPEKWWAIYQAQGPWAFSWRYIPAGRIEDAWHDAFAALEPLRAADGSVMRTLTFAFTTGPKAT